MKDRDLFTHKGVDFRVYIEDDDSKDPPWKDSDCHGVILEAMRGAPINKQRLLRRNRGLHTIYDWEASMKVAERDNWGLGDEEMEKLRKELNRKPSKKQVLARAVERDFKYLRDWCQGYWKYIGVCVTQIGDDEDKRYEHALWRIESNAKDYIEEVAHEHAEEILREMTVDTPFKLLEGGANFLLPDIYGKEAEGVAVKLNPKESLRRANMPDRVSAIRLECGSAFMIVDDEIVRVFK